jgi:DNA-binding PadR family transcriptional regulator
MRPKGPTPLEYALLGLLHQREQSGYDLRKIFAATALGNYSSSPGTVYPALKRLEKGGLVEGRIDERTFLRPRRVFRASALGSEVLRRWLSKAVSREDVARGFDEVMLRFAFHAVLDDATATHRFLLVLAQQIDAYVKELEGQRAAIPPEAPVQTRLALEAGIEQYRTSARWARGALEHFKQERG